MSEAADFIADLDDEIATSGQDITLGRLVKNGVDIAKLFRAVVRGYKPVEVEGGLQQGETELTLSPTGLPTEFGDTDATRLRRNDFVRFDGRDRNVWFVEPVRIAGELVRMNVTVRG